MGLILHERAARPGTAARGGRGAWVVGSGKGGVGKSLLATLLAAASARAGRDTLLLDGAQRDGNLHVLLGRRARGGLSAVARGDADPGEMLVPLADRLWLLPAPASESLPRALSPIERARLHLRFTTLYPRFAAVVVDAGPGLEGALRAVSHASALAVVAAPEPAALSDAYALVKLAHLEMPHLPVGLLVNRAESPAEADAVHARLALAAQRFLERELPLLGAVSECDALRAAARRPGGALEDPPASIRDATLRALAALEALAAGREAA